MTISTDSAVAMEQAYDPRAQEPQAFRRAVISVLERRSEIGLRRSLGATRRHIRLQFRAESLLLSALVVGVMAGGCPAWRAARLADRSAGRTLTKRRTAIRPAKSRVRAPVGRGL